MRHSLFTAGLAVLVSIGTMGCQSAPKLAWWKSSNKSDVRANAVAHSAPQLPSEIARQTEGLAPNASAQNTFASTAPAFESAPAFDASRSSEALPFPSTGAPDYSGGLAQASSASAATPSSSSAMPYNPSAVPPPTYTASTPTPAAASVDRYGMASSASGAPAFDGGIGGTPSISEAAAPFPSTQVASTPNSSPAPSTGFSAPGLTGGTDAQPYSTGDRYATSTPSAPAATQSSSPSTASGTSQSSGQSVSLASSAPYRPGGTSTYPSTGAIQPSYEIATRPAAPTSTSGGSTQQVPNVATPDSSGSQYR